jgi:competence protein ComGC
MTNRGRRRTVYPYTLVETLTILFFIATVAFLTPSVYQGMIDNSDVSVCQSNLRVLVAAIDRYQADHHRCPLNLDTLVRAKYISSIPHCPSCFCDTYRRGYRCSGDQTAYTIRCMGREHQFSELLMGCAQGPQQ